MMVRRLLASSIIAVSACTSTPAPTPTLSASPSPTLATLYYKLSTSEPWSAKLNGDLPAGWHDLAKSALEGAGLHPVSIEQVRIAPPGTATCFGEGCPNLHALKVAVPESERNPALAVCFVVDYNDQTPPAIKRSDCDPIYPR